jgi:hypothetical protein
VAGGVSTDRVLTLTSMMSSTGEPEYGRSEPAAQQALFAPRPADRAGYVDAAESELEWASKRYRDRDAIRDLAARSYDRGYYPAGLGRQLGAMILAGSRAGHPRPRRHAYRPQRRPPHRRPDPRRAPAARPRHGPRPPPRALGTPLRRHRVPHPGLAPRPSSRHVTAAMSPTPSTPNGSCHLRHPPQTVPVTHDRAAAAMSSPP